MRTKILKASILGVALSFGTILLQPMYVGSIAHAAPAADQRHQISPNIPLHSYVYDYLDKLDGLGYLANMQTGTKPYTRLQVARWIQQMSVSASSQSDLPKYVKSMLNKLESDFQQELDFLAGSELKHSLTVKEITFKTTYYDGDSISHKTTRSTYQPLNINNDGQKFAQDLNYDLSLRLEGYVDDNLVVSATPRLTYDDNKHTDTELAAGYIKSNINNVEIQFGKQPVWWGQGNRGGLILTNNAEPQTSLKLSNVDPMHPGGLLKFLGPSNVTVLYSEMGNDRQDVKSPSFFAARADFTPGRNFSVGWSLASIVGGDGRSLSSGDYWDFIRGKNAETAAEDKWNSIGGLDFRWRLPKYGGLQVYGELYGEDQAMALIIPTPSKVAETVGVYIPRLSADGSWDARLEYANTTSVWYRHSAYKDGYVYKGDILGDAMGNNSNRYFAKITHYDNTGSSLSLNLEQVNMDRSTANHPKITSAWLSTKINLDIDTSLNASAGIAHIKNNAAGSSDKNYLVSLSLVKLY